MPTRYKQHRATTLALAVAIILSWQIAQVIPAQASAKPIVNDPMPQQKTLEVGASTTISVTAADPDNDPLQYSWSAVSGVISGSGRTVNYETPKLIPVAGVDTITVTVSDGENTVSKSTTIKIEAPATPTKLYFAPDSGNITIGAQPKEIKVILDAGPITVSQVDLVATYNSTVLELVDENPSQPGTQIAASATATTILRNEVQPTSTSINQIVFSATYPELKGAQQHIATLHMKALKAQKKVPIQFQFLKFAVNDTNVIKSGTTGIDALQEVGNAEFNLMTATKPFAAPTTAAPAGSAPAAATSATPGQTLPGPDTGNLADTGPSDAILAGLAFFLFLVYLLLKICAPRRS